MPQRIDKLPDMNYHPSPEEDTYTEPIVSTPKLDLELGKEPIEFTVSGEPVSGSQLKFNQKTGHAYRPKEHKQRVFYVYEFACQAVDENDRPYFPRGRPLELAVIFYFPYRNQDYGTGRNEARLKDSAPTYVLGNKDLDNLLKPLKDGMKGVIYHDDKQIVSYSQIVKLYSESPRTHITVKEME